MADLKIDDATIDDKLTGVERVPASDGGVPKSILVSTIANYVFEQLPSRDKVSTVNNGDNFTIVRNNVAKLATGEQLCQLVIDWLFAKASITPNNESKIPLAGSSVGTISYKDLVSAVSDSIDVSLLLSSLSSTSQVSGSESLVILGDNGKKIAVSVFARYVVATLGAYISSLQENTPSMSNYIIFSDGVSVSRAKIETLLASAGNVKVNSNPATGKIPVWGDNKTLRDGYLVKEDLSGGGDSLSLPTTNAVTKAIDSAIDKIDNSNFIEKPTEFSEGKIPTFNSNGGLNGGLSLATTIRGKSIATNNAVVSEKAVREELDKTNETLDGLTLDTIGEPQDVTDNNASVDAHGLLPKLSGNLNDVLRGNGTWQPVTPTAVTEQKEYINANNAEIPGTGSSLNLSIPIASRYSSNSAIKIRLVWKPLVSNTTIILRLAAGLSQSGAMPNLANEITSTSTISTVDGFVISDVISITPTGSAIPPSMLTIAIGDNSESGGNATLIGVYLSIPLNGNASNEEWL